MQQRTAPASSISGSITLPGDKSISHRYAMISAIADGPSRITNYSTGASNTNPSSGATGRYQILPSTAAGYGCNLSTPAGQDACAQTIYNHQGAGAWVGCGG